MDRSVVNLDSAHLDISLIAVVGQFNRWNAKMREIPNQVSISLTVAKEKGLLKHNPLTYEHRSVSKKKGSCTVF